MIGGVLRVLHHALVVLVVVFSMAYLSAQAVVDPRYVEFNASVDHDALSDEGDPLVTRYSLAIHAPGSATALTTVDLGKPDPNASNVIRVDFLPLLQVDLAAGVNYEARVTAAGPGGAALSSPSNQFSFAPPPCTPAIAPGSRTAAQTAGSGTVSVTAGAGCAWTAQSNTSWITVTGGASGSGNGTVSYSITANSQTTARVGTVAIAGHVFTLTQAPLSCSFSISPTSRAMTSAAGSSTTSVTAPSGCAWTAQSNTSWITVTGGASGSGNGTVSYSITANSQTTERVGTVAIAGHVFTLTQAPLSCSFSISPTSRAMSSAAGSSTTSVTAPSGCAWTAQSNTSWITVTGGASGSGNGTVSYSITANPQTTARVGTVAIAGHVFTLTQAPLGCSFSISPTSRAMSSAAGSSTTSVTAPSGCAWTAASNNPTWLSISSGVSGTSNGVVTLAVTANTSTQSRTGTLTVGGQALTVSQEGTECSYAVSPTVRNIADGGGSSSTTVSTTSGCPWTAASNNSWITITSGASGTGSGNVNFTTASNQGGARNGTLTVAGRTVTVSQSANTCSFSLTPTSRTVHAGASTHTVQLSVTSGCAWTASSDSPWLTVSSSSGTGSLLISYSVAVNPSGSGRTGRLTIGGQVQTINQNGATRPVLPGGVRIVTVTGGQ